MNALFLMLAVLTALAWAAAWPVRRWRLAVTGATSLAWGLVGGALLTNEALHTPLGQTWVLESTASAAEEPASPAKVAEVKAEAETTAEADKANADLAPQVAIEYPADRPAWVEADFINEGGDVQRISVASGPFLRKQEALRAFDDELEKAVSDYVVSYLGNSAAGTLVPVDAAYIKQHLIKPDHTYSEVIKVSVGPMHQVHGLVEFDSNFRSHLDQRWKNFVVTGRVAKLGVIAAGVLLVLSVVFGYFKADTATRGYRSTRLQLVSAMVILGIVAGGFAVFQAL